MGRGLAARPVLVVEHEALCPPAWLGEWLEELGVALDVRRPYAGEPLPAGLDGHNGLLVLGGSMGADDDADHPWLVAVKALVREAAATEVPTLGICLGHQLCAVALGGRVEANPYGQQVGVLDVGWSTEASTDPLLGDLPRPARALQWNGDVVTALPAGAVVLAATAAQEVQAARFAPTVWGVQWHPEAGEAVVTAWAEVERDAAAGRGLDLDARIADVAAASGELRATWVRLAQAFAAMVVPAREPA